jgi:arylsulfatase I/J
MRFVVQLSLALLALTASALATATAAKQPHMLLILADDYGWNDIGVRNKQILTPHMDQMIKEGIMLERHYVFKFCSPSRSSAISARLPIHVNQENSATVQPYSGIMANFTTFPERLKEAGYSTAMVGKWHCGQAAPEHIPAGRGFDTSLGFFNFGCDHYTQRRGGNAVSSSGNIFGNGRRDLTAGSKGYKDCQGVDLWKTDKPAYGLNGTYSGYTFSNEVQRVISNHDTTKPLFMYIAWQNDHAPLEVPAAYEARCDDSLSPHKKTYCGMTSFMDEAMGNITSTLKKKDMWADTLVVFSADNGGWPSQSGDNFPLIGGKFADLEGGKC